MILKLDNITKTYNAKNGKVIAMDDVSCKIQAGKFISLRGPSGCGKTTLLMVIAGMLRPTAGQVIMSLEDRECNIYKLPSFKRASLRAKEIGFIFQMFHLIPYLNVVDNVRMAAGSCGRASKGQVIELLESFGLSHRLRHLPGELSAGEKQRVAIARAMLNEPSIILADEPTGNLDPDNAQVVMKHLAEFRDRGGTVIVATHTGDANAFSDQTINMESGRIRMGV